MSERPRNEKEEKDEKGKGESWDEKWRSDPVNAAVWAFVLIWAGLVLLAANLGWLKGVVGTGQEWSVGFLGAGVIVLLGVLVRLVVPAYRRPIVGSLILGLVFLGIGLGGATNKWEVIGPLVLIGIGLAGLAAFFLRRKE